MTKAEMIEKMANEASISKVSARHAMNSFINGVTQALKEKNGKITLAGFGTFSKSHIRARTGRHPSTGESIEIKARNVVKFNAGKSLKDAI